MSLVKKSVTIYETVGFLNELLRTDKEAISSLFSMRIMCNEELADHKTVQVQQFGSEIFQVGLIGVLNGLFGINKYGWGHIVVDYADGKIIGFRVLTEEDVKSYIEPEEWPGNHGC